LKSAEERIAVRIFTVLLAGIFDNGLIIKPLNGRVLRTYPQINFAVLHPGFRASLTALQSQNPRRSPATPVVLLNHARQIYPKSKRNT
jgi:hypothetical protein